MENVIRVSDHVYRKKNLFEELFRELLPLQYLRKQQF
jgi:hypothetical protein